MPLELGESWPAWHPDARRASWTQEGFTQEVLAVLGRHSPGAVARARTEAQSALSYRGRFVFPLLGVEGTGRHVAWLYPAEVVIALAQIPRQGLGPRAAAEIVRDVARTLEDVEHPGPSPEHVLIDQTGTVRVAHFVGPFPGDVWHPPNGGGADADRVFRLGLLLAWLLGTTVDEPAGAVEHEATVRRVLLNAMSAPGAPFDETYRELVRDLLAWDPRDRPSFENVVHRLDGVVHACGGARLEEAVSLGFVTWLMPHRAVDGQLEMELADLEDVDATMESSLTRTLDGEPDDDEDVDDDPTVDSELGVVPVNDRTPTSAIEFGSLPIEVGPPPEAVRRRPTLPPGFLGNQRAPTPVPEPHRPPAWLTYLGAGLVAAAITLLSWLLFA